MKQTVKKIFVLTLAMVLALSQYQVSKADLIPSKYKKFIYAFDDGCPGKYKKHVKIWDYKGKKKKLVIPQKIKGEIVREVYPFEEATFSKIKSMYIPKTVWDADVSKIPTLKNIKISKKNKWLSVRNKMICNKKGTILKSCPGGLKKVTIPKKVKKIGVNAFWEANIREITLRNNIQTIKGAAFSGCPNLEKVNLGENIKEIDILAFSECKKLKEIVLPKGMTKLDDFLFFGCSSLEKVVIEAEKVTKIGNAPFGYTKEGIKIYVKNEEVAKKIWKVLLKDDVYGVKNANIYVGEELVYANITSEVKEV